MKQVLTTLLLALAISSFQIIPARAQTASNPTPSTQQGSGTSVTSEAVKEFGERAFNTTGRPRTPVEIGVTAIRVILGFLGIIAVILIVYAGFQWMTSGGDSGKIASAKSLIINAVIGLVIILTAYAITEFIVSVVLTATQKDPFQ